MATPRRPHRKAGWATRPMVKGLWTNVSRLTLRRPHAYPSGHQQYRSAANFATQGTEHGADHMTDPTTLTILGKIGLALLCGIGGICAIFIGKGLYLRGLGIASDGSKIAAEKGDFKVNATLKNTGTVLMVTSVLWAGIGLLASPSFEQTKEGGDSVKVTHSDSHGSVELASFHYDLDQIAKRQQVLSGDIPLTPDGLAYYEKDLRGVKESIRAASQRAETNRHLIEDPEVSKKLETIKQESAAIEDNYSAAHEFSITRNSKVLAKLLPLGSDLSIAIIERPAETKIYRKNEAQEFSQDIDKAVKEGTPRRVHMGTYDPVTGRCAGLPEEQCGSLELTEEDGNTSEIQWHLSPGGAKFDEVLAAQDRHLLARAVQALSVTICEWYERSATSRYGRNIWSDSFRLRGGIAKLMYPSMPIYGRLRRD